MSLAFDRSERFALDKAAGQPCPLLGPGHECSIHSDRERRGFGGCVTYDCLGAGPRVTEELFGGRSWQTQPALARPMLEAFWRMRQLHELVLGLRLTERLALGADVLRRRRELERRLDPPGGFDRAALEALALEDLTREVRAFLASVRDRLALLETGEPAASTARARSHPGRRRLPLI